MGYHGKQYKGASRDTKILKRQEAIARDVRSDHQNGGRKLSEGLLDERLYTRLGFRRQ